METMLSSRRSLKVLAALPSLETFAGRAEEISPAILVIEFGHGLAAEAEVLESLVEDPAFCALLLVEAGAKLRWPALLRAGNCGILTAEATAGDIEAAVRALAAGMVVIDPDLTGELAELLPLSINFHVGQAEELSRREIEVLRLLSHGLGNKGIALELAISEHTVKFHISSILGKLGVSTRTEAVTRGFRLGLIVL